MTVTAKLILIYVVKGERINDQIQPQNSKHLTS